MPTNCPIAVAFDQEGQPRMLRCGKWSCWYCRANLAQEWAGIVWFAIQYGRKGRGRPLMWTLTLGSRLKTVAEGYVALKTLWDAMRKAIQRDQGQFDYCAFCEGQPNRNGMPHFHIITFSHVPKKWSKRRDPHKNIKDFAAHYRFGAQAKEKPITSDAAAAYVSKYVSKGTPNIPKGFRRVRTSQTWPRPPERPHKPYVVRSVGEPVQDYLMRVEEICDRPIDDLLRDYQTAQLEMELAWLEEAI